MEQFVKNVMSIDASLSLEDAKHLYAVMTGKVAIEHYPIETIAVQVA